MIYPNLERIEGNLWDLTVLQNQYCDKDVINKISHERLINSLLENKDPSSIVRVLSNNKVRSKATAFINIQVGLAKQTNPYTIYHDKKGFYCDVQSKKYYLKEIL
jgi:hypothetical protein